ncbi:DinB family protein [Rhizobium sp. BK376]|uniref:DinB family protein n=1 Tax=Rhizobium sp. BK376 TaxID=2512149 RepID=UPI0010453234|nr:DinB family protein [Rhizobium sp. BK376]TCR93003.1 putative damage-inducible protein DinB [Rhizobium sp. BK376]
MPRHLQMFANYNRWANRLLFDAAATLTDTEYHRDMGAFFGSLHRTLDHLMVADMMWMHRFTGSGDLPQTLGIALYETLETLDAARQRLDQRIIDWVAILDEAALSRDITYRPVTRPMEFTHPLGPTLFHLFNHQTHHRGQCHAILTALGKPSLEMDLIYFLRGDGQEWLYG